MARFPTSYHLGQLWVFLGPMAVTSSDYLSFPLPLFGLGKWVAHDCGNNIILDSAGNRRNACVFKAIGRVLPLTDWLVCLHTLRLAAVVHQALPNPLPKNTPSRFTDFARRTKGSRP